jgi:hypothetical protein
MPQGFPRCTPLVKMFGLLHCFGYATIMFEITTRDVAKPSEHWGGGGFVMF